MSSHLALFLTVGVTSQNFTPRVSFAPREISLLLVFGAFRRTIFGGFAEERFLRERALRRDDDEKMNRRREKSFSSRFPHQRDRIKII